VNKVYFYDIGPLSKDADILVTKNGFTPDFSWAHIRKIGWEYVTDTSGFTPIDPASFVVR